MGAITQNDIQQDHGCLRVTRLLQQTPDAQIVVDHGVRPANGELFLAQVYCGMPLAVI